jgi:hypothetical protein
MRKSKKVVPRGRKTPKKFTRKRQPKLFTEEDAARFNVTPPDHLAYRWVETENLQRMLERGWLLVPPYAHPEMPSEKDRICYLGNVLVSLDRSLADAIDKLGTQKALKMVQDFYTALGLTLDSGYKASNNRTFPILSPHFMATADYPRAGEDDVIVEITIPFRMTPRWQDVANALNLSHQEYAQRRVALHLDGRIAGLLLRDDDGAAFQVRQVFVNEGNSGDA